MRNPPENFYANDSTGFKWLHEQFKKNLSEKGFDPERKYVLNEIRSARLKEKLKLDPDKPVYLVYELASEEKGVFRTNLIIGKDSFPMVFQPDFTETEKYKRQIDKQRGTTLEEKQGNLDLKLLKNKADLDKLNSIAPMPVNLYREDGSSVDDIEEPDTIESIELPPIE